MGTGEKQTRRDYLKFVGGLAAGLAIGGVAAWLGKPAEVVEKTVTQTAEKTVEKTVTQTVGAAERTVTQTVTKTITATGPTKTITTTATGPTGLPWIGDYLSAPLDPGWTQWPRKNPPYRIGLALPWTGNPWRRMQLAELDYFMKGLKEAGWVEEYRVLDAGGDVLEQKRNIQELIEWGCDATIIDPVRGEALIEDIERVMDEITKLHERSRIGAHIYFVLGALTLLWFFPEYSVGIITVAVVSDALASLIGRFGRVKIGKKTFEGFLAYLTSGFAILTIFGVPYPFLIALTGAIVELFSIPPDDNFSCQIAMGIVALSSVWLSVV